MNHPISQNHLRNTRAFLSILLSLLTLAAPLTPLVVAAPMKSKSVVQTITDPKLKDINAPDAPAATGHTQHAPASLPFAAPPVAAFVPNITATKTDAFADPENDGRATPGQTITYSVTITNNGTTDATNVTLNDTVDANTTLVAGSVGSTPLAINDAFNVIGNVRIQPNAAQGLLANDQNPNTGNNTGLTVSGPTTSTQGGQVTVNADGSFSYNPPPGFEGTDTFTYTVTNAANETDTATVTLTVNEVIWFIDNNSPVGGDGRITSPFNSIAEFNTNATDEPGDIIFIFTGGGPYTGPLVLLNTQQLLGQGIALAAATGLTPPTGSDPLPAAGTAPTIVSAAAAGSNTVTLAQNNTIRGLILGNSTGLDLIGSGFATLTTSVLTLNGTGRPLSLTNGTLAATFDNIASTSSSGGAGLLLSQVAGTMTVTGGTSINGATTQGILVNQSTANINFGNTTIAGGTDAVSLQNNSGGTRTFGTLGISGNSGIGFVHAVGGGNTNVTGATTITNPAGTGIDIQSLASGTTVTFAATSVIKTTTAGTGVNLTANGGTGSVTFFSLNINTSNGTGLIASTGTYNVTNSAGSITATGGPAILGNAATVNFNFNGLSNSGGAGRGIDLNSVAGIITASTTNVVAPTLEGISVTNSSVNASFGATTINKSNAGHGLSLATNTGTTSFTALNITAANGRAINSSSGGTLNSTSGVISATTQEALLVSATTLGMTLTSITSTNVTGGTGDGINISGGAGSLTAGTTTVTNPSSNSIDVSSSAMNVNFGNATANQSGGTGVLLASNTGAATFADLDIAPDAGQRAFHATSNTGAISSTSGALATLNQTAVEIIGTSPANRTPLNLTLTSVNVTGGNVAPNGILLQNTSATGSPGGFRVVGNGGSCTEATPTCTGGQIQSTAGTDSATPGNGIRMIDVTGVSLALMRINNHQNNGIRGDTVSNFSLANSLINGTNGTTVGAEESSVFFNNLTGTSSLVSSVITGGIHRNVRIDNSTGTLTLTVNLCTIKESGAASGDDGLFIEADTTANVTANVTNNTFSAHGGDHFNFTLVNNAIANVTFTGNTMSGGHAIGLGQGVTILGSTFDGTLTYNVSNNTMTGTRQGGALHLNKGSGSGTFSGRIENNLIGTAGVVDSGASESSAIRVEARGTGSHTSLVNNNTIHGYDDMGMNIEAGEGNAALNATITNNTIATPGPNTLHGIHVNIGTQVGNANQACIDIRNNTLAGSGVPGNGGVDIRLRQRQSTTVRLPGYVGANNNDAAVQAFVAANNPGGETVLASNTVPTGGGFIGGAACTQPLGPETSNRTERALDGNPGETSSVTTTTEQPAEAANHVTRRPFVSRPRPSLANGLGRPQPTAAPIVTASIRPAASNAEALAKKAAVITASAPVINGNNLVFNIGTLPVGESVTITFQATVNSPFPVGVTQVSNQGTVSGDNFTTIMTDDPSVMGANNPTVTLIQPPVNIFIRDGSIGEPSSSTTPMTFSVVLSAMASSIVTVNFATASGGANPATAGANCGAPGVDYETTSGTVTFAPGTMVQTVSVNVCSDADTAETDETFLVNLSTPANGIVMDAQAVGTINPTNAPGTLLISELRTSGPGVSGTGDADDELVELYNNTGSDITVSTSDGSTGWALVKSGADCDATPVIIATIPNGTVIPARGHYLAVGTGYSLNGYASGDITLSSPIEDDRNVALFNTSELINLSSTTRLDAVGFGSNTGNNCALLREGTNNLPASGDISQHSFVRKFLNPSGLPQDTNDNAADFLVVSTTGAAVGSTPTPVLGAPGPENLASPRVRNHPIISSTLIDPAACSGCAPNRVRDTNPYTDTLSSTGTYPLGTLSIRRTFTNHTGGNVTRLRYRIINITTLNSPNVFGGATQADLRALTSPDIVVNSTNVTGTTLETPPAQPDGGGLNSSLSSGTITLGTPLAPGASISVQFLLGVRIPGRFNFFVNLEAVP